MRRAPIASTRACSTASNTARACWPPGCSSAMHGGIVAGEAQRDRIGMAAHDRGLRLAELARRLRQARLAAHQARPLGGEGNFKLWLARERAQQPATARLNGSVGDSFDGGLALMLEAMSVCCPSFRCASAASVFSPCRRGQRY